MRSFVVKRSPDGGLLKDGREVSSWLKVPLGSFVGGALMERLWMMVESRQRQSIQICVMST